MKRYAAMAFVGMGALVACAATEMPTPSEGQALFAQNCASCHGADARGNPAAGAAVPDLTRIALLPDGAFPRTRILSEIDGYTRVREPGQRHHVMPEFGVLLDGETVPVTLEDGTISPVPRPLAALLAYLESVQG
ncbi:MAG: c-type cytochrome [Paracoccaceae bacterium]